MKSYKKYIKNLDSSNDRIIKFLKNVSIDLIKTNFKKIYKEVVPKWIQNLIKTKKRERKLCDCSGNKSDLDNNNQSQPKLEDQKLSNNMSNGNDKQSNRKISLE